MRDVGVSVASAHTDASSEVADLVGVLLTEGSRQHEQAARRTAVAEVERPPVDTHDVQAHRRPGARPDVCSARQDRRDLVRGVGLDVERVSRTQVKPGREAFADRDFVGGGFVGGATGDDARAIDRDAEVRVLRNADRLQVEERRNLYSWRAQGGDRLDPAHALQGRAAARVSVSPP